MIYTTDDTTVCVTDTSTCTKESETTLHLHCVNTVTKTNRWYSESVKHSL